jgi:hypothetical protein
MPRKTEEQIKRSEAAKKAWETIRANKLRDKRRTAALKAWDTRRANQTDE